MRIDSPARSWLFALGALGLLAGCPGTLADKERYLAALTDSSAPKTADGDSSASNSGACGDVVARIFVPTCGGTGCHGAKAPQQDLDLVSPGVAARVVGVAGKGCSVPLADPTDPEGSLIYQKLSSTAPCGAQMPLARPPLNEADTACVLGWIAAQ